MEVILLENIGKLGNIGDKVAVKAGFGRNFLMPQGKAVPATAENLKDFEARRAELEAAAAEKIGVAKARAASLEVVAITITANAGDEGKLFGSIGTRDIADAVSAKGHAVKKSEVTLPMGVIREVGTYDVSLRLHSDLSITVQVVVEAEA